jgi:hypothetical protein
MSRVFLIISCFQRYRVAGSSSLCRQARNLLSRAREQAVFSDARGSHDRGPLHDQFCRNDYADQFLENATDNRLNDTPQRPRNIAGLAV